MAGDGDVATAGPALASADRRQGTNSMKTLVTAAAVALAATTALAADQRFWVVGNRATGQCSIVSSNPLIDGDIYFGDGPYKSKADAKIARSTIRVCPPPPKDEKD